MSHTFLLAGDASAELRVGLPELMGGKKGKNKVAVSGPSSNELSRLKSEYEEVIAKLSKEGQSLSTAPGQEASTEQHAGEPKSAASAKGDYEFEEITVTENWMRFFKANAELLVLYGLIEVTMLLNPIASWLACMIVPLSN